MRHQLPQLYERVFVPATVIEELRHTSAPLTVAAWLHQMPEWIEVRVVSVKQDAALEVLDPGEREAIQLAEEQHADLLLIDERHGRLEAKRRGIATTGTLGVLLAAGKRGLVDPDKAFQQLINETTFRATPEVRESFVKQYRESRKRRD